MQSKNKFMKKGFKNLSASKIKMKRQFDKKVNPISLKKYEIGNQVLILNYTQKKGKLENRYL